MMKNDNAGKKVSGFSVVYPVKERIFIYFLIFFTVLSILTGISNRINGLDISFNYKWFTSTLISLIMLFFAFKRYKVDLLHRVSLYFFIFILLPASGFTSTGLVGPGIVYSFILLVVINYLMSGKERIFLDLSVILVNIMITVIFKFYPEVFKPVTSQEQFFDWVVTIPVVSVFVSVLLIAFERAYETKSERLKELSIRDPLTGLYNRIHMGGKLSFLHDAFLRTGVSYSVIMIDIDFFKKYNDLYGHPAGDECLIKFGRILKDRIYRNTDWVYRYGGEEFLILLGFSNEKSAELVAKQIQKDLESRAIIHESSEINRFVTVSIGIASIKDPRHDPEMIIKFADEALYRSKKNGRNRISIYG